MAGSGCFLLLLAFSAALLLDEATAQVPGFQSWNCGGKENFIDEAGIEWTPDNLFIYGHIAQTNRRSRAKLQYATLRYFPSDNRKYCYSLSVMPGMRYLLRPTFLYGNFDGKNVYPKFQISLGVTYWSTIIISNVNTVEAREMIFLATESAIHMCLFNATRGRPFISTLELRPFNGSMYSNDLEEQFYVSVSARINFGAVSDAAIRYPDDPFDRIWYSDHSGKPNEVLPMADGIKNLSTDRPIDVGFGENPPQKVMQTAVLGTSGLLSYKLKLHGFAGNGWVISYFAEIEDFGPQRSRKFRVAIPFASIPHTDRPAVNIQENSGGKFRLCEHYSVNVTLNSLLSFEFIELPNSSEGPLLNAMEISKYIEIKRGSPDADVAAKIFSSLRNDDWAQEGGDPCLPVNWSWLLCSSESAPRITSILLSGKNLTGNIPSEFTKLTQLKVLRLDGNSFIGSIPDFTNCQDLKIIHLENNQLTGSIPPSLANLQKLRELYLQNNMLSGKVPIGLFRKNLVLNISGNVELEEGGKNPIALMIVVPFIIVAVLAFYTYIMNKNNRESQNAPSHQSEGQAEPPQREAIAEPSSPVLCAAHRFRFSEMKDATNKFQRKIGSGGFGVVYYGMLKNGREIAVKVLSSNSKHGEEEFLNEVTILSRAHHTNLVELLGYCQEDGKSMLVYEYAPNGNLEEHLAQARTQTWMQRLSIAEGAARGIVYLHTQCSPSIMHRDLKSRNILLDRNFTAKVGDFGLSKPAHDGSTSYRSKHLKGTFGYIDPAYMESERYTDRSDVYSFGVILFEIISGKKAVIEYPGGQKQHITHWALPLLNGGNLRQVIDSAFEDEYEQDSAWKIARTAQSCVHESREDRPSITDVLREIQQARELERERKTRRISHEEAGPTRHRLRTRFA